MHLRKSIFILTVLLILGCEKRINEIRYYPSKHSFSKDSLILVGLDTGKLNFIQIAQKVDHHIFYHGYGNFFVEFDDGQIKKRIAPLTYGAGLVRQKNGLTIASDSIHIDDGYPISDLNWVLKRHYLNKGRVPYYSDSPKRAFVEISIDTNSNGMELKEILTKITRSFDAIRTEINDSIVLRIYFDNIIEIKPPPPAPSIERIGN